MKIGRFFCCMAILASALNMPVSATEAQVQGGKSNVNLKVSIDPIWVFFGAYLPTLEAKVNDQFSVRGFLGFVNTEWTINKLMNEQIWVYPTAGVGLRYYATGKTMSGVYMEDTLNMDLAFTRTGLSVTLADGSISDPTVVFVGNTFDVGYAWVAECGLSFEAFTGMKAGTYWGYNKKHSLNGNTNARIGLRVGYAF